MSADRASAGDEACVSRARSELSLDLGGEVLSLLRLLFASDLMPGRFGMGRRGRLAWSASILANSFIMFNRAAAR